MAKMLVHDAKHLVEAKGFIRAIEPCVCSGAMAIALAQALKEEGINYQQCLHVTAIDLGIVAVHRDAYSLWSEPLPRFLNGGVPYVKSSCHGVPSCRWPHRQLL